ncbi:MAG TPA: single-stranded DNA-binding protein [Bacteriovoracaceae bacterium]|nr:single-stranded DNA-binding protein [Bacteriovoracaceae bacterium]
MAGKKVIFGRLGKNPELRYTSKQEPVCYFSVAETISDQERPYWHNVVVWGKQAEQASLFLKKGGQVFVRGQNLEREYRTTAGETKKCLDFRADDLGFLTF